MGLDTEISNDKIFGEVLHMCYDTTISCVPPEHLWIVNIYLPPCDVEFFCMSKKVLRSLLYDYDRMGNMLYRGSIHVVDICVCMKV